MYWAVYIYNPNFQGFSKPCIFHPPEVSKDSDNSLQVGRSTTPHNLTRCPCQMFGFSPMLGVFSNCTRNQACLPNKSLCVFGRNFQKNVFLCFFVLLEFSTNSHEILRDQPALIRNPWYDVILYSHPWGGKGSADMFTPKSGPKKKCSPSFQINPIGFMGRMYRGSRIDSMPSGGIICHQYFFLVYSLEKGHWTL